MSRMIDDEETLKDNGLIEIDGVNVKECEFFDNKEDECLIRGYGKKHIIMFNCKHNPNCYFKQLKRLETENKKAQKRIQLLSEDNSWHCIQCTKALDNCQLQAENEKLRKRLHEHISKGYCECEFSKNLVQENERLKKRVEELNKMTGIFSGRLMTKYRKALEDIRNELLQNSCANSKEIRDVLVIIDEVL